MKTKLELAVDIADYIIQDDNERLDFLEHVKENNLFPIDALKSNHVYAKAMVILGYTQANVKDLIKGELK